MLQTNHNSTRAGLSAGTEGQVPTDSLTSVEAAGAVLADAANLCGRIQNLRNALLGFGPPVAPVEHKTALPDGVLGRLRAQTLGVRDEISDANAALAELERAFAL